MASISRRAGGWRVLWRIGGRDGRTQSATFTTQEKAAEAKRIIDAHRGHITRDEIIKAVLGIPLPEHEDEPESQLPTVAEFAETWLASRTRVTPGTKARYRRQLETRILPAIGHLHLDQVGGSHIAIFLNRLHEQERLSPATCTRYYAVLHSLFGFALAEHRQHLHDNAAKRTDFVRDLVAHDDTGDEGHVYLTRQEFDLIYRCADPYTQPLLLFLVDTGTRFSEATAVDIRDVDLLSTKPQVLIRQAWKQDADGKWYRGSTKGRNRRTIRLTRRLAGALLKLTAGEPGDRLLFRSPRGGRVIHSNWRMRYWLPALAAAARCPAHPPMVDGRPDPSPLARSVCDCPTRFSLEPTPHDLRHTHVAWLIAARWQLLAISRRLGHHNTEITERVYASILPEVDDVNVAALDEAAGVTAPEDVPALAP